MPPQIIETTRANGNIWYDVVICDITFSFNNLSDAKNFLALITKSTI